MTRRALAGAALFVVFALGSQAQLLHGLSRHAVPGADPPSRAERRLSPLRGELPARGTVGYRAEPVPADPTLAVERYFMAHYVLCPVVLQRRDQAPLVIDTDAGARVETSEAP
jgi:hypothetical protein